MSRVMQSSYNEDQIQKRSLFPESVIFSPPRAKSNKTNKNMHSHTNRNRDVCVHTMDQDYPLTGPSPGTNLSIYTSSIPLV
jgi:hypothetical protein